LVGDCRDLLAHASAIRERATTLRREDSGILKVAAAPGFIESVFADFLHTYAKRYPNVQVKLVDVFGAKMLAMLDRGEINLGQSLLHSIKPNDRRFASHPLLPVDTVAACHPKFPLGSAGNIEIARLAPYPLLLLNTDFTLRLTFDAACRLAGLKPNVLLESRDPRTLVAMAEAGHGVAIIPSVLRMRRSALQIISLTYRGKPLREPAIIVWDKRRPRPRYSADFCEMVAEYAEEIFRLATPQVSIPVASTRSDNNKRK
jgi:DNA-binding transcriptional LysR family regulator